MQIIKFKFIYIYIYAPFLDLIPLICSACLAGIANPCEHEAHVDSLMGEGTAYGIRSYRHCSWNDWAANRGARHDHMYSPLK